jgi:uncharacterized protein YpuA (DUF1002 family)
MDISNSEEQSNQYFSGNFFKCSRCSKLIEKVLYNCENCDSKNFYCEECFNKNKLCDKCNSELKINKWFNQIEIKADCPLKCGLSIDLNKLKEHLRKCKNRYKSFECKLCEDEIFEKKDNFIQHILDKHKEEVYKIFSE